jgi:L-methionine (R)-S-oxide reductase
VYEPLTVDGPAEARARRYAEVRANVAALLDGESDWTTAMATVVCELHHAFEYYNWTGFYRVVGPRQLAVGPYQGTHGCLRIAFDRGVCGACAREQRTQLVPDVEKFPDHVACSTSTRSEIVVPVVTPSGSLLAVLDIDSDQLAAFTEADRVGLEVLCADLAARFAELRPPEDAAEDEPPRTQRHADRRAYDLNETPSPTSRYTSDVDELDGGVAPVPHGFSEDFDQD